jgi:polyisoprenoid-binding protein YceI
MSRTRLLLGGGLAAVLVLAAGAWWLGYFDEPAAEANVDDLAAAVQEQAETEGTDTEAPLESLDGVWTVTPVEGQTFIGYRINEVLNTIGDFTVVGRTAGVTGSLEAAGTTITAVSVVGDMTSITTDNSGRDNAMKSQALETDLFPEATFELVDPIELGSIPPEGTSVSAVAVGDLTIHGVTQRVEFPLDAQIQSGSIVAAGQLEVQLADFGINAPSARIVASVEDVAILELSLVFSR